jgi:LysM repeat protein
MRGAALIAFGLGPQMLATRVLTPRQSVTCDFSTAANSGDTCSSFAAEWGLSLSGFEQINPGVPCDGPLTAGQDYCVIGQAVSSPTSSSTTTTTTTTAAKSRTTSTTTTTTPSPVKTSAASTSATGGAPSPTQSGLAANCNKYHLVASGDSCQALESANGISAAEFSAWNPSIDSSKAPRSLASTLQGA